ALLLGTYFLEILIDNTMARLTWRWMLSYVWIVGLVLSVLNLSWLYAS
ncbi:MAG: NADH-quinone oxidoreductase subunit H, partial [Desulfocurvibacter africanus]